jgi:hypothetical protein
MEKPMKKLMKKLLLLGLLLAAILLVGACSDEGAAGDATQSDADAEVSEYAIPVENAFLFTHVDGHKEETDMPAFVLFEYEQLRTVKYQVAFIACTCRGPEVNYWSVAFVEINKDDNTIESFSMEDDNTGKYTAGLYGDSYVSWDGTEVWDLFQGFIDDSILGRTEEEIDSFEAMHGNVDTYTGATVTPNNNMRMLQGLFEYHKRNYG